MGVLMRAFPAFMFDDWNNTMLLIFQIFLINIITIDTNVNLDNFLRIISENLFKLSANGFNGRFQLVFIKLFIFLGNLDKNDQHLLHWNFFNLGPRV